MPNLVALPADACLYFYKADPVRVVDGDTVDLTIDLGFRIRWTQRFRLAGIDALELNSTDANERAMAQSAREALIGLLFDPAHRDRVRVITEKDKGDKYGRWLATIHIIEPNGSSTCVNSVLLESGLARPYSG